MTQEIKSTLRQKATLLEYYTTNAKLCIEDGDISQAAEYILLCKQVTNSIENFVSDCINADNTAQA